MCIISETWPTPKIPDNLVKIPGYSIYRCDGGKGGGVGVYVRDNFRVNLIPNDIERPPLVEDIWITVQHRKYKTYAIGFVYRHPRATVESFDYLSNIFRNMCLRNQSILIMGDFNDNILVPNSKIMNISLALHVHQLVNITTRITATSSTWIDLIFTNENFVFKSDVISCPVGDHELLTVTIDVAREKSPPVIRTYRSLKKYSKNVFCE